MTTPIDISDCICELVRFTLSSSLDGTLEIDLPFSKAFCSRLLLHDPHPPRDPDLASIGSPGDSSGVPSYPLYKHLGYSILTCITSGKFVRDSVPTLGMPEVKLLNRQEDVWKDLIASVGLKFIDMFENIGIELHVQECFFSQLKAGLKSVEGRCAVGNYTRIAPGTLLLFNKCLVLQAQNLKWYKSFKEMLETESLTAVLPGVKTVMEGVQIYRNFYSEEKEMSNGVLAISLSRPNSQPYLLTANILSGLSYEGIARLLGLMHTIGTVHDALPPPTSALVSSFISPNRPEVKGSLLTTGARALAKHANRGSDGWWGTLVGSVYRIFRAIYGGWPLKGLETLDSLGMSSRVCCGGYIVTVGFYARKDASHRRGRTCAAGLVAHAVLGATVCHREQPVSRRHARATRV